MIIHLHPHRNRSCLLLNQCRHHFDHRPDQSSLHHRHLVRHLHQAHLPNILLHRHFINHIHLSYLQDILLPHNSTTNFLHLNFPFNYFHLFSAVDSISFDSFLLSLYHLSRFSPFLIPSPFYNSNRLQFAASHHQNILVHLVSFYLLHYLRRISVENLHRFHQNFRPRTDHPLLRHPLPYPCSCFCVFAASIFVCDQLSFLAVDHLLKGQFQRLRLPHQSPVRFA